MTVEIETAINRLYDAFADVAKPQGIAYCSHCHSEDPYTKLVEQALRSLSVDDLEDYLYSVFNTGGDKTDFVYLFPRMCELAIIDQQEHSFDIELVFLKAVRHAEWQNWPPHRRSCVRSLGVAILQSFSEVRYEPFQLDSWICALAYVFDDLTDHLRVLLLDTEPARFNLAYFHDLNREALERNELSSAWWEKDIPNYGRVISWFSLDEVRQKIQQASHLAVWPCEW